MVEVAFSILLIVIVLNPTILSSLTGSQAPMAVVKGESMLPILREGDIVFTYKPNPSEIKIGDVIVYKTYTNKLIVKIPYLGYISLWFQEIRFSIT
jgi:signal peptidase